MVSRIIVALDGMPWNDAYDLAISLKGYVWGFKLNDALLADGTNLRSLSACGGLMLDPKLYDIPQTVANSVAKLIERIGPDTKFAEGERAPLITVHASAGRPAMRAAVEAAGPRATILAITALTSFDDHELFAVYNRGRAKLVRLLALRAHEAGIPGLVCSTDDLKVVRDLIFMKVVPGIRLPDDDKNDQIHVGDGADADLVVVGRPITKAKDPIGAAMKYNDFLERNNG